MLLSSERKLKEASGENVYHLSDESRLLTLAVCEFSYDHREAIQFHPASLTGSGNSRPLGHPTKRHHGSSVKHIQHSEFWHRQTVATGFQTAANMELDYGNSTMLVPSTQIIFKLVAGTAAN